MASDTRRRFAEVVADPDGDLAEAALLCCVEADPELDVDAQLARLDEMAARLRDQGFAPGEPMADARALSSLLADDLGFTGDTGDYHAPHNGLLHSVLDRRRGLPITVAIIYIAVGQRVGIDVFGLNTPAHFLVGVGRRDDGSGAAALIDAFHAGTILSAEDMQRRLHETVGSSAGLLQPATTTEVIRRLLNNLTRDFLARRETDHARWTVELKRLLPDTGPGDVAAYGEVLTQLGQYREAAHAIETFLAEHEHDLDEDAATRLAALARRSRAQLN